MQELLGSKNLKDCAAPSRMDEKRVFQERTNFVLVTTSEKSARDPLSLPRLKSHSKNVYSPSTNYNFVAPSASSLILRNHSLKGFSPVLTVQRTMQVVEAKDSFNSDQLMARHDDVFQAKAKGTTDSKSLRNKRYSKAEQELIDTFARCRQEKSLQELQIASLRKATSILNTHIADSKERLDQLRTLLADRGIEPDLYKAMQRERWMEEKRQLSTIDVSKVLEQCLSYTISSLPATSTSEGSSGALNSKTTSNLVKFLESPGRRIPTRNRARRVYVASIPHQDRPTNNLMHDQEDILEYLFRPPQRKPSFIHGNLNPVTSTILSPATTTPQASSALPNFAVNNLTQLASVDENIESYPDGDMNQYIPALSQDFNGSITIWKDSPRSKEEILAKLVVDMPDYVNDLLSGLDSTLYTPASLDIPQEFQTPRSTFSRASFMPETPRSQRSLGTPSHAHKSPSRKRISVLFSLPEALSSRRTVNAEPDRLKHLSTPPVATIAEETTRPFSVSFSGLPSSESGGSHDHGADYKPPSRLRRRLSFFKRH